MTSKEIILVNGAMEKKENVEKNDEEEIAKNAVLVPSASLPADTATVKGYDFNKGLDYHELFKTMIHCGFQATNFALAIEEVNRMLHRRSVPLAEDQIDQMEEDEFIKRKSQCTIFLGYTSNMVSSGIREIIRFLVQHKLVDCLVTTAGGVEEDFIKCLAPTYIGSFYLDDRQLREKGLNRTGNLLVPNDNYCLFEDWAMPKLDAMLAEQKEKGTSWTPSKMIAKLGEEINHEDSIYYWAARNKIPVFCPALTDGSLGDMMFFHTLKNPGLVLDIIADVKRLNRIAMKAVNSGMIIVGGGVIKHHICNANLMRNGADYAVFINTSSEFDGSDSGARPEEAISWGKIRKNATPVKVCADATLVFPLLVGETFGRYYHCSKDNISKDSAACKSTA
ncbi:probable deoxyhypusine synthase [Nylanderia fulva]|uniref:probable deoxyhypusine synthase n=1 Tax=Nylanderia fulva TaxID=613905 RepID=UPI0010FB88DD|nr:probable deoxyhypusine synthase [Nylanderia fulva]XP_029165847.1 probable deoxyhypusine synthase [Nylanderia fulva]